MRETLQRFPELKGWAEIGPTNQVKIHLDGREVPDSEFIADKADQCLHALVLIIENSGYHWKADDGSITAIIGPDPDAHRGWP